MTTHVASPAIRSALHRVLEPAGVLPQAAERLDPRRELWDDEVRIPVERLNLDAASFRQLARSTTATATRSAPRCSRSCASRGKMHNPVTGSGGMLVGVVEEVGPRSPLGLTVGQTGRHAGLADADAAGDQGRARALGRAAASRCRATATRSCSAARSPPCCPTTCPSALSLAVFDVCGAPALTDRVVEQLRRPDRGRDRGRRQVRLAVPRRRPSRRRPPHDRRRAPRAGGRAAARRRPRRRGRGRRRPRPAGARDAVAAAGGPADVTVVCVDVPGCEGGAILATARAAPSSSSRWRPRSPPPRWAPRAWPPT